jgi:two-component system, NarL family, nitrate/nitrite response regulator NarL
VVSPEDAMSLQLPKERIATRERQPYIAPLIQESERDPGERFADLIKQCSAAPATRILRRTAETTEEIVYEADIAGVRYYLVRCRPHTAQRISLSPRELAIAQLIAKGLPNKTIGDILEISPWTVATHLRRIFGKLGVTSRAAMVARLVEEDLL